MRRLYFWTLDLAASPYALWALAVVAFIESSVFPIPPDVMLIPMILAARHRAWLFALVCTIASVLGGFAGYMIGYGLFESVGQPLLGLYGYDGRLDAFRAWYQDWGAWIVLGAGLTPFPYKVITIASGVLTLDLATFMLASTVARGLRFFAVAALLYWFGPAIRGFIERRFGLVTVLFFVALIGGFLAIRYVI